MIATLAKAVAAKRQPCNTGMPAMSAECAVWHVLTAQSWEPIPRKMSLRTGSQVMPSRSSIHFVGRKVAQVTLMRTSNRLLVPNRVNDTTQSNFHGLSVLSVC